ncbi:hypothetical protein DEA06_06810 [Microbacterium sp. Gd 4-13]|uniref:AAA family ATPase n=1 Tax=Microbacterium sp. Gd 4-13 TaxID=2173179 RepID=UPI000D574BDA|nr:AAA family ATPase [Microbacterium sp. Gd 4-13]PVW05444.1 hypothetical protein DEA06_06810 [Microbacterium sp. Gd 4-13]
MAAATVITMSSVQIEPVAWLWTGRIPEGKLVLFDGDPSAGKSTLTLDLAARLSSGTPWPDGALNNAGDVLLLSAEDGIADTIAPRLEAAGADMDHVHALTEVPIIGDDGKTRMAPPTLPRDIPTIRRLIRHHGVRLVVIDVLMAFLSGQVDSHRDQDIRRVLHELANLADETGCTIVLVRHLNKAGGSNALYRGGGSIGIIGAARAAFLVARDPDDPERRFFAPTKSNLAAEPPTLAYRLVDSPAHGCARVEWEPEPVEYTASAILGSTSRDDHPSVAAVDGWLATLLSDGPVPATEVYRQAEAAGFSIDQTKRARKRVATLRKDGMTGSWIWSLPNERTKGAASGDLPSSPASELSALPSAARRTVRVPKPRGRREV